eukprot:14255493-Alexandrium_andersonii.AAC.1
MSASLVGSEMCIRDRAAAQPRGAIGNSLCPAMPYDHCQGSSDNTRLMTCLLYTSDAADDM